MEFIIQFSALVLAFGVSIIGHEIMHGAVAKHYGDDTAKNAGRLTINPIKHIDPFGSIIFPLLLFFSQKLAGVHDPIIFGWAKPVPVNMFKVIDSGGYLAAVAVSLAGVTYNFFLALIASSVIGFFYPPTGIFSGMIFLFLYYSVLINVILAVFNLIPIPPLDGANALRFLSLQFGWSGIARFYNKIEPYGMILLLIILFTPIANYIFKPAFILINWLLG